RLAPLLATPVQMLEDQLLFAAEAGRLARVELLLRHGVDPNGAGTAHPTLRGRSAHELALANGHAEVAEALAAAGGVGRPLAAPDELLAACMRGDGRRARELSSHAPAALARDPARIVRAAELGRLDAVRLLVELGFDPSYRDRTAPLHLAAYAG